MKPNIAPALMRAVFNGKLSAHEYLILEGVGKLRTPVRQAFTLCKIYDMNYEQVARHMKVTPEQAMALLVEAALAVEKLINPQLVKS